LRGVLRRSAIVERARYHSLAKPVNDASALIRKELSSSLALVSQASYLVTCWNCLGEFDAAGAVWCSDDPKNPTKLCPFCLRCFCEASAEYKQQFWRHAPALLVEELQTLSRSQDRLGDILIRMKKITTPQLLEALVEQRDTGRKLGEILVRRRMVDRDDVDAALRTQGVNRLQDTKGGLEPGGRYWDQSDPETILDYLLALGARKRASDVSLEPRPDQIAVRYRIDGFSFRVDSIPKSFEPVLEQQLFTMFGLDPALRGRPQSGKAVALLGDAEYDLVLHTVPGTSGVTAQVRLIDRSTFIKDFTTLGLQLEERVALLEETRTGLGLLLVVSPAFNGAITTYYSIMSFLAHGQRDVLSIESPIYWAMDGVRQVEAELGPDGPRIEATLRAMVAVRPDVLMLSSVPDHATAVTAAQLASSLLVVGTATAPSAARGVVGLRDLGMPPQMLAGSLGLVMGQRLVRTICRICRVPADPPASQTLAAHGIGATEAQGLQFYKGKGCPTCNTVGYRGRRAVFEVLPASPEVRQALERGRTAAEVEAAAVASGMVSLRERCLALVREGVTTFDEFARLRL
jgi:type II secretory ATPase GspE/PulE/Tfp pilus assembly ATPase PilB-like protein